MKILFLAFVTISIASDSKWKGNKKWNSNQIGSKESNNVGLNNIGLIDSLVGQDHRKKENKAPWAKDETNNLSTVDSTKSSTKQVTFTGDGWGSDRYGQKPNKEEHEITNILNPQYSTKGGSGDKRIKTANFPQDRKIYETASDVKIPASLVPQNDEKYIVLSIDDFVKHFEVGSDVWEKLEDWPKCGVLVVLEKHSNGEDYNWTKCLWDTKNLKKREEYINILGAEKDYIKTFRESREEIARINQLQGKKKTFFVNKDVYDSYSGKHDYWRYKIVMLLSKKETRWNEVFEWIVENDIVEYINLKEYKFVEFLMTKVVTKYDKFDQLKNDFGSTSPVFLEIMNNRPEIVETLWSFGTNKKEEIVRLTPTTSASSLPNGHEDSFDQSVAEFKPSQDILYKKNEFFKSSNKAPISNQQPQKNSRELENQQIMSQLQEIIDLYEKMSQWYQEMNNAWNLNQSNSYEYYKEKYNKCEQKFQRMKEQSPEAFAKFQMKYDSNPSQFY